MAYQNNSLFEDALHVHRHSLVIDAHTDVHLHMLRERGRGKKAVLAECFYSRWRQAGIDVVVLNTPSRFGLQPYSYSSSPTENFLLTADAVAQEIAESPDKFYQVLSPEDIMQARGDGRVGLMLGTEGAEAVGMNVELLRCFYRLGLRIMNLTWHHRNYAADGVSESSNSGLSNFGRELVAEMNRLGIIIDLSHASPATVRDVLSLTSQPVIASHSNACAVYEHQRNLHDWQIEGIAASGGVIGVVFLGRFVAGDNPSLEDVCRHVDHLRNLVGSEHIAIGPDYVDYCHDLIIEARRIAGPGQPTNETHIEFASGVEEMALLPNFTAALLERGYEDSQIKGILGENFLRVFEAVVST